MLVMQSAMLALPDTGVGCNMVENVTMCYIQPPMIQGHEFVGEVVKLGPG